MAVNRVAYPITQVIPWHGFSRSMKVIGGTVALTATDVGTINNTVQLFSVPKGFVLTGMHLEVADLDSNGSPTLTLSLGDATLTTRLGSALTTAQAGGLVNVLPAAALGFKYAADTDIQLLVAAAAATGAAGNLTVFLEGFIDA
jgi:hypothetical protein